MNCSVLASCDYHFFIIIHWSGIYLSWVEIKISRSPFFISEKSGKMYPLSSSLATELVFYLYLNITGYVWVIKCIFSLSWLGGSVGWSIVLYTKRLWVQFPQSGHIPRLQIWSPLGVCTGGNWLIFLTSCSSFSSSLPLSFTPSLTFLSHVHL